MIISKIGNHFDCDPRRVFSRPRPLHRTFVLSADLYRPVAKVLNHSESDNRTPGQIIHIRAGLTKFRQ